ncbi:hypothetical protein ANTRET_LOCUS3343 [Anthophora retusa]
MCPMEKLLVIRFVHRETHRVKTYKNTPDKDYRSYIIAVLNYARLFIASRNGSDAEKFLNRSLPVSTRKTGLRGVVCLQSLKQFERVRTSSVYSGNFRIRSRSIASKYLDKSNLNTKIPIENFKCQNLIYRSVRCKNFKYQTFTSRNFKCQTLNSKFFE